MRHTKKHCACCSTEMSNTNMYCNYFICSSCGIKILQGNKLRVESGIILKIKEKRGECLIVGAFLSPSTYNDVHHLTTLGYKVDVTSHYGNTYTYYIDDNGTPMAQFNKCRPSLDLNGDCHTKIECTSNVRVYQ